MNNREKIIGGDSLGKPTGGGKKPDFLTFLTSFYLKVVYGEKLLAPIGSFNQYLQFLREITYPLLDRKVKLCPKFFHGYLSWNWLYQ